MSSKVEITVSAFSAILSFAAVIISGYSYKQVERQVQQGGQQVDLAREALSSNERNAAFLDFTTKMTAACKSLDFSASRNAFSYSLVDAGDRLNIVASYQQNYQVPRADYQVLLTQAASQLQAVVDAKIALNIWLENDQSRRLDQAFYDYRLTFTRELTQSNAPLTPDLYHRMEAYCFGTRDALVFWYKSGGQSHLFPTINSVTLTSRSP